MFRSGCVNINYQLSCKIIRSTYCVMTKSAVLYNGDTKNILVQCKLQFVSEIEGSNYIEVQEARRDQDSASSTWLNSLHPINKPFILKIVLAITVEFVLTYAREYVECNISQSKNINQIIFSKLWLGIKPNLLLGLPFGLFLIKFMQVAKILLRDILLGILQLQCCMHCTVGHFAGIAPH